MNTLVPDNIKVEIQVEKKSLITLGVVLFFVILFAVIVGVWTGNHL